MKKLLFTLTCLAAGVLCFGQTQSNVESRLYNDINSFFNIPALLEKSEDLFYLQRYEAADETLDQILSTISADSSKAQFAAASYWSGRVNYCLKNNEKAIKSFYNCQEVLKETPSNKMYSESAYYCSKLLYAQQYYPQAISELSFIYSNGDLYSKVDYSECVLMLFTSLNKNSEYSNTVALYEKLPQDYFAPEILQKIRLQAATAYEKTEKYLEAYNLYCQLIESEDRSLAVTGLQKAYGVAHNYELAVKPEELFVKLEALHSDTEELISEFWVRLGIDYYEKKNFAQSRECFNAVSSEVNQDLLCTAAVYEAKMDLDEGKKSGSEILEYLKGFESAVEKSELPNLKDSYYSQLTLCYSKESDWANTTANFSKVQQPDEKLRYIAAYAYYKRQAYRQALAICEENSFSSTYAAGIKRLRAGCYAKKGDYKTAENLYSWLSLHNQLTDSDRLEYAKVLLALNQNQKAVSQAIAAKQPVSEYIAGLASYNLQNWSDAEMYLNSYLTRYAKVAGYSGNAYYYKAFAVYKQGKNQQAYDLFSKLGDYVSEKRKLAAGYEAGAVAAVVQGNYKAAAVLAEKRIDVTSGKKQQEAILFCADVYSDGNDYVSAVELLKPYTETSSDFALQTSIKTANIYEKAKKLNEASEWYETVYKRFTNSAQAEEALYRPGEMYYSAGDYKTADVKFSNYIKVFGNGKFTQAAYYYSGECNLRSKDYNRAILQNKLLLSKFPNTIYGYGAYNNLLQTYYEMESYGEALDTARNLLKNYEKQAVADGIGTKIQELEKINSGVGRELAEKISQFEKYGKETTFKGRVAGTDLVKLYAEEGSSESMTEAVALAEKLLALQTAEDEMEYGAANGDFAAEYYYQQGEHKKAADLWLKAAEYYRACGKNNKSAEVLYSAADSFNSAGLKSDAQATAKLLISLYPETVQAQRVNALFK